MKRKSLILAGITALMVGLVSCNSGNNEGEIDFGNDGKPVFRNVSLTFSHVITWTDNTYLTELVNEFNKEYQGQIVVRAASSQPADLYGNLPLTTANNRNADVMLMHAERVLQFAAQEDSDGTSRYFRELDDIMELAQVTLNPEDFPSGVWDNMRYNDEQYGIPFDMHMAGIYVNTSMLNELGFNEVPTTREGIIEAAQAAIAAGHKGFQIANGYPDTYFYINAFFNYGGKQIITEEDEDFDPDQTLTDGTLLEYQPGCYYNDATYKAANSLRELLWDDATKISDVNLATDAGINEFRQGNSLFTCDGIWLLNDVANSAKQNNFEMDVIPMSTLFNSADNPDYTGQNYTNGHIFVMPKHTLGGDTVARQQASMVFIQWMLEHSQDWAESGKIPAYGPARETDEYKALPYLDGFGEIDNFVAMQANRYTYSAFSPSQQTTTMVLNAQSRPTDQELEEWVKQYYDEGIALIKSDMSGGTSN